MESACKAYISQNWIRIGFATDGSASLSICKQPTVRTCDTHLKEQTMKALITHIATSLVDRPEQVSVTEVPGNHTIVLELTVAKEDLGKVIGKQGKTAMAIRTILSAVSSKNKKRTVLEIIE
jgi:predicted RNA-binding protein YlqC (UPF0109 family)